MPSPFTLDWLRRKRGLILIFAFFVSTLIETIVHAHTAPDLIWMSILAISMYLVFEISLLFARLLLKR
jgi:Sec-independent protein secretion pathway component TatC